MKIKIATAMGQLIACVLDLWRSKERAAAAHLQPIARRRRRRSLFADLLLYFDRFRARSLD